MSVYKAVPIDCLGSRLRAAFLAIVALAAPLSAIAADLEQLEQKAFRAAADAVAESVVQIRTIGGLDQVDGQAIGSGPTTGLIVRSDGLIVSSAFNFAQSPSSILVRLPNGEQRPARLIGRDANRMLVLLKVDHDESLPTPAPADADSVRPGDWAVAVGRTHRADRVNMSVGVVSALNRMHGRMLQTDANTSAANYGGPLVDINGRVLGIIVPMGPESASAGETSATAGVEFYDSGIGFAAPLEHVLAVLPRWLNEKDLQRGLLGVSLAKGNPHRTPATVTATWPQSPAAAAGLKPKDRIVAVDGKPIQSQTDLRFQVVPRYAGDKLKLTARRGKGKGVSEVELEVTLADKLPPFRHAFLGVLPERSAAEAAGDDETSVVVRTVWPDSPADEADIRAGDQITQLGDESVQSLEDAHAKLAAYAPDDELSVTLVRGEDEIERDVKLAELPVDILSTDTLQTSTDASEDGEVAGDPELEELRLPEMPQVARYALPAGASRSLGLVVWLGGGNAEAASRVAASWQSACRRDGLILLMPEPREPTGWAGEDMEYLARLLRTALQRFPVDSTRVVIVGEGKAGQLAYALAFQTRQTVRGVAVVDSPLPRTLELPDNNPNMRFAVLSIETPDTPLSPLIRQDLTKLREAGYPTTVVKQRSEATANRMLDAATRGKLARWIDGLDRF